MTQTKVVIPEKIFFKIGEVCDLLDVQAHVLRYWETEFSVLSPKKNRSGQRTYRRRDVEIALRIKELLYEELYTIAGAKRQLQMDSRGKTKNIEKKDVSVIEDVQADTKADVNIAANTSKFELNDERREALKLLTSQFLELREMMKSPKPREVKNNLDRKNLI